MPSYASALCKLASGQPLAGCLYGLKKCASGVLASLRGSTYRSVRLAASLAAAFLDGLFEQPAMASERVSEYPDLAVCSSSVSKPY
jgi:acetylornithine/succinyldiaminopimelate/putrescine aminotransferase